MSECEFTKAELAELSHIDPEEMVPLPGPCPGCDCHLGVIDLVQPDWVGGAITTQYQCVLCDALQ